MTDVEQLELKLVLLGEAGVGKTAIIGRYVKNEFSDDYHSSATMSYVGKTIKKDKFEIHLNIWDTIGQERYRALSKLFFNDTKIVILLYSIDCLQSFKNLQYWLDLYKEQLGEGDTVLGIAGNKSDLFDKQEVPDEQGKEYAEKNGAIFSLISAKTHKQGIDMFIEQLIDAYLKKINKNITTEKPETKGMKLNIQSVNNIDNSKKSSCCGGGGNKKKVQKLKQ